MTNDQEKEVHKLLVQAWTVRALQVFISALGVYLAICEKRGWPAFLVGIGCALWFQTRLPVAPDWAEKLRKTNK